MTTGKPRGPGLDGASAEMEEAELVKRARQREEQAFERIFRLHKDRVFSICVRMTGNFYEAEDLLQETFFRVFENIGSFRGESALGTWIHRVAVNVALDALRKHHPLREQPYELSEAEPQPGGTPEPRPADRLLDRMSLERAIAGLPAGYRLTLVLHDVEGFSHQEIGQWLGISPGTCKSQLHKARRKLRELLTGS